MLLVGANQASEMFSGEVSGTVNTAAGGCWWSVRHVRHGVSWTSVDQTLVTRLDHQTFYMFSMFSDGLLSFVAFMTPRWSLERCGTRLSLPHMFLCAWTTSLPQPLSQSRRGSVTLLPIQFHYMHLLCLSAGRRVHIRLCINNSVTAPSLAGSQAKWKRL